MLPNYVAMTWGVRMTWLWNAFSAMTLPEKNVVKALKYLQMLVAVR